MVAPEDQIIACLESRVDANETKLDNLTTQLHTLSKSVDIVKESMVKLLKSYGFSGEDLLIPFEIENEEDNSDSLIFKEEEEEKQNPTYLEYTEDSDPVFKGEVEEKKPIDLSDEEGNSEMEDEGDTPESFVFNGEEGTLDGEGEKRNQSPFRVRPNLTTKALQPYTASLIFNVSAPITKSQIMIDQFNISHKIRFDSIQLRKYLVPNDFSISKPPKPPPDYADPNKSFSYSKPDYTHLNHLHLVNSYSKCWWCCRCAHQMFDEKPESILGGWFAVTFEYSQIGCMKDVILVFTEIGGVAKWGKIRTNKGVSANRCITTDKLQMKLTSGLQMLVPKLQRVMADDSYSSSTTCKGSGAVIIRLPHCGSAAGYNYEVREIHMKELLSNCKVKMKKIDQVGLLEDDSSAAYIRTVQELLSKKLGENKYPPTFDPIKDMKLKDVNRGQHVYESYVQVNKENIREMLTTLGDLLRLLIVSINEKVLLTTYGKLKLHLGKHNIMIVKFTIVFHAIFRLSLLKKVVGTSSIEPSFPPGLEVDVTSSVSLETPLAVREVSKDETQMEQWLIKWNHGTPDDATWKDATTIRTRYSDFRLEDKPILHDVGIDKDCVSEGLVSIYMKGRGTSFVIRYMFVGENNI